MRVPIAICAALVAACSSNDVSRDLGARCATNAECNERCLTGGDWPGGFCSRSCMTDAECPTGSACISEQGGVCAFTCKADPDCAFLQDTYACKSNADQGGGQVMVCRGG